MGVFTNLSNWYENQKAKALTPEYREFTGGNVPSVSMDSNQAGSTDLSRRINAAVGKIILSRHPAAGRIIRLMSLAELGSKLPMGNKGDVSEGQLEHSLNVTYDPYIESILAEVMSSQQTERKLESAPKFIRPKKRLYRKK